MHLGIHTSDNKLGINNTGYIRFIQHTSCILAMTLEEVLTQNTVQ